MKGFFVSLLVCLLVLNSNSTQQSPVAPKYDRRPTRIVEGDIAESHQPGEKNANIEQDYATKWANGVIPYVIDSSYSPEHRQIILDSMNQIQRQTNNCIKFVELQSLNSSPRAWLRFLQESGCWSYIGQGYGEQWVSLVPGCMSMDIIVHELMHAVGFWHEQSRPDRDDYLTINWPNVMPGYEAEFYSRPDAIDTLDMPYDYNSIMHYRYNTFAIDRSQPTLIPKNSYVDQYMIGTRNDLSEIDILKVWKYYGCF